MTGKNSSAKTLLFVALSATLSATLSALLFVTMSATLTVKLSATQFEWVGP